MAATIIATGEEADLPESVSTIVQALINLELKCWIQETLLYWKEYH
jgi:hypothetical protein